MFFCSFFFFFQAEDGIRDLTVTGVQTCALPICIAGEREQLADPDWRQRGDEGRQHPEADQQGHGGIGNQVHLQPSELVDVEDRKSTRLNSSHSQISYAVFCLKKKKKKKKKKT